jgi:hypothetical protein
MVLLAVLLSVTTAQATMCWEVGDPYEPDCSRGWGWERVKCDRSFVLPGGPPVWMNGYDGSYEESWECSPGEGEAPPHCWETTPGPDTRSGMTLFGYSVKQCEIDENYDLVLEPQQSVEGAVEFEAQCVGTGVNELGQPWALLHGDGLPEMFAEISWTGFSCAPGWSYSFQVEQVTSRGQELGRRQPTRW